MKIYKPESYTWQMHALINSIINEYEEPTEDDQLYMDYDPFLWYNPWDMQLLRTPSTSSEELSDEDLIPLPPAEPLNMNDIDWNWWSEQLYC